MTIHPNDFGLYEFEIEVSGKNKSKKLKGLIDTGSTDCVCTYELITTLQIRPVSHEKISIPSEETTTKRCLVYNIKIEFDSKSELFPVYRIGKLPDNIHFILGMSVLSRCEMKLKGNALEINWTD